MEGKLCKIGKEGSVYFVTPKDPTHCQYIKDTIIQDIKDTKAVQELLNDYDVGISLILPNPKKSPFTK